MKHIAVILGIGVILLCAPAAFATITLDSSGATVFQQTVNNPCVIGDESCKEPTVGQTSNHFDYTAFPGAPDTSWNGSFASPAFSATTGAYDVTSPVPFLVGLEGSFKDDNGPYLASNTMTAPGFINGSDAIPTSFTIGIDVNYTDNQEQLVKFITWKSTDFVQTTETTGTGTWSIDTANSYLGPTSLLAQHNGNGYSDAILTGFNLQNNAFYFFEAVYGLQVAKNSDLTTGSDGDGMEEFFLIPAGSTQVPEPTALLLLGAGLGGLAMAARGRVSK